MEYKLTLSELAKQVGVRKHPDWFSLIKIKNHPMPHQLTMMKKYVRETRYGDFSEPGCVSADTEYLTPTGWKRIDQYVVGDLVAQFNPGDETLEFVYPSFYTKITCDKFYHVSISDEIEMKLSGDHRVLYYTDDGEFAVKEMDDWKNSYQGTAILGAAGKVFAEERNTIIKETEADDGFKYCFTVSSGFLVLRYNRKLFTTGNCGKTYPAHFHAILMAALGNKVVFTMPPKLIDQFAEELREYFLGIDHFLNIGKMNVPATKKAQLRAEWDKTQWPDILLISYDGYREWNDVSKDKKIGSNQWYYEDGSRYDPDKGGDAYTKDGRKVSRKGFAANDKHLLLTNKGYNVFFFDEAHALCGMDSIISTSVVEAAKANTAIYLMTGTPVPTVISDAYGIIRIINPEAYVSQSSFARQHIVTTPMTIRAGSRTRTIRVPTAYMGVEKIHEELFKNSIRVQKRDVNKLPNPVVTDVKVHLTGKHKKLYQDLMQNHFAIIGETILAPEHPSQIRHMSLQIISCPTEFDATIPMKNELFERTKEVVDTINPVEHKIIVFAYYKAAIRFLAEEFKEYKPAVVYGDSADPTGEINRFKNDPDCRMIIINWVSGGAGLNLQVASHIIFYECPTSPKDAKQAIARADRTGQHNIVNVYFMRVMSTLSDRNFKKLLAAEEDNNQIVGDELDLLHKVLGKKK